MDVRPGGPTHLRSLTGLRFFAAMGVVLYHLSLYFPPLDHTLDAFGYGFTGVSFFFVLSGFVLTWSHREGESARKFYRNRFARVWPLHAVTTFLSTLVPPLATSATIWPALPFVLTLTQAWVPAGGYVVAFNGISWSLSCEAFFYLSFPFLIRIVSKEQKTGLLAVFVYGSIMALGIYVSMSLSGPAASYLLGTMPLYRLGEFVVGMCLALMIKRGWRPRLRLGRAVGVTLGLYVALMVASIVTSGGAVPVPATYANFVMIPGFVAVIAAAATNDLRGTGKGPASKTMVRLGRWSFALYLVHELVIRLAKPLVEGLDTMGALAVSALVVVASLGMSGLLHEFVESPCEKWLRSAGKQKTWPSDEPTAPQGIGSSP